MALMARSRRRLVSSHTTKFFCVWMLWISSAVRMLLTLARVCAHTPPGAKISGHRGYFLTNDGVDLNQALISYALDFLRKDGYKKIQPPFFMNKDVMGKTAQLDQFDEELYKVLLFIRLSGSRLHG